VATLGEAYIAVKADMRPFTRDLKKEVEKVVKDAENNVHKGLGDALTKGAHDAGGKASDEFANEFDKKTKKRYAKKEKQPWMISIAAALAGALDDGISALPMQVKASIVGGILLALPFISGALAGAVSGALGAAVAGLGVLLAFQFEEVRTKASDIFGGLRVFLANLAQPFVAETLKGLDRIGLAFLDWEPQLRKIFANASGFVEPLERGVLGAFDKIIGSIANVSDDLDPFVKELSGGFEVIGDALGDFLEILVSTGEDGQAAFRDLIHLTADFIVELGYLIKILTEVYGFVRKIYTAVPLLTGTLSKFFEASDVAQESTGQYGATLNDLSYEIEGTVAATKNQEKAIKDAAKAMDQARDAAFNLIDANVDYEESIDRLDETLKENGRTLDTTGKEGRENIRAFTDAFKDAQTQAELYYQQGKFNAEEARGFYEQEVRQIEAIARARGVDVDMLHRLYGESVNLVNLPEPNTGWLNKILYDANKAADALARANYQATQLNGHALPSSGTRPFSEYAAGGIVDGPTAAIVGEAGPEVIIPLSRPGRAAQLAQQSGLADMLGSSGQTMVYVYLGNDQLEPYLVRVVDRNNKALATSMAFGSRGL
jgi:ABC-type transporter Mla subunit MlaD